MATLLSSTFSSRRHISVWQYLQLGSQQERILWAGGSGTGLWSCCIPRYSREWTGNFRNNLSVKTTCAQLAIVCGIPMLLFIWKNLCSSKWSVRPISSFFNYFVSRNVVRCKSLLCLVVSIYIYIYIYIYVCVCVCVVL